jgi:hypothetical protein
LASSVDIATYSSPVQISVSTDTFAAFQISSDSALDADVIVKLQQSSNSQLIDIDGTSKTIAAGENTVLIETNNFTLGRLYLSVDVGSATAGTLTIDTSNKKKEISTEVNATIEGDVTLVNGITSSVNSSTTLLNTGNTFTGTGELNDYSDVMVQVSTDQNGVLYCEFSPDGTNWDTSLSFNYNTSRINPPHVFVKGNRYFRVRFENDSGSNQTYLRLYTYYGSFDKLTAAINGTLSENYDAIVTRPTDYHYEVAMSKRQGNRTWNKFGYNTDVDTASEEIIASFGGTWTSANIMTSADTLDVVSSSTSDAAAGTGAITIGIEGIDANHLYQFEMVSMNGTTAVTTTNTWLGVNRAYVLSSGSNDSNVGTITIDDNAGTVGTQAEIPVNESTTQQCLFHTQINHSMLLDWLAIGALKLSGGGGSPRVTIKGYSYSRVTDTVYEVFRSQIDTDVENHLTLNPSQPFVLGGREVIWFTADTNTNNTEVGMRFSGIEQRVS